MGQPLRVLIVEDSEDDALLIVRELQRAGYTVSFQRVDSVEAMAGALTELFWDIILADYSMPHFSGLDALELLKKTGLDIPFIFVSGAMGEDTAVAAMKAGAQDYVLKDNLKRLLPAIGRELREAETRRQRKAAEEELRRQEKRMWALYEINLAITFIMELRDLLRVLLQKIHMFLPYAAATLCLLNKENEQLEPTACTLMRESEWREHVLRYGPSSDNVVMEVSEPFVVRNVQKELGPEQGEFFRKCSLVSYVGVPLIAKGEILGVLGFYTDEERDFEDKEVRFLSTLAGQAAIAISNSRLYEKIKSQAVELEKANNAKDEFLVLLARQLSETVNAAVAYTEAIQDKVLRGDKDEDREKVVRQARELLSKIKNLLEATESEAGVVKGD